MPISDDHAKLPLAQIFIDRDKRQRREPDTKGLKNSIERFGLINAIVVEKTQNPDGLHKLTTGERRYLACQELGWTEIPVRFAEELTAVESEVIELEENVKRTDLTWQETVQATARIHALCKEMYPDWNQDETAENLGLTKGTVSVYLNVAQHQNDEKIWTRDTVREAWNVLNTRKKREEAAIVDSLLKPVRKAEAEPAPEPVPITDPVTGATVLYTPPPQPAAPDFRSLQNPAKNILCESFVHWAPKYSGPPFNLIHCDFPYGINVFDGPQAGGERHQAYEDTSEVHLKLLETLLTNFDKIASRSCHVVYWFSMQHYDKIRQMVTELVPDLIIWPHPLIWVKSDNSGIAADSHHFPRHVYETALFMSRGKRRLVNLAADAYSAPTDRTWHIHTKPEPVLKYFFNMLVDQHTNFLDPTCGSGSSVRAAEALGARWVLGMDIDETIVGQARVALRQARAKAGSAVAD